MLPKYLFVGPTRTGTTWIHEYLRSRGDVCLPVEKETFFFDRFYSRGVSWYESRFNVTDAAVCVEVAPSYFRKRVVPVRVRSSLHHIEGIIVSIRNPVDRAYSAWFRQVALGREHFGFIEALTHNPVYVDGSLYSDHISDWEAVFPSHAVNVLWFDDLKADAALFAHQMCLILGIDFIQPNLTGSANESGFFESPGLAALAQRAIDYARERDATWVVEIAKSLRLKHFLFRRSTSGEQIHKLYTPSPEEKRDIARQFFRRDIESLAGKYNRDLSDWL